MNRRSFYIYPRQIIKVFFSAIDGVLFRKVIFSIESSLVTWKVEERKQKKMHKGIKVTGGASLLKGITNY